MTHLMGTNTEAQNKRRHDLDWLRVIAFGLLIFYHVGMFYVSWGWHVKSMYASDTGESLMRLLNPWRLSLLFFISGVAVKFLLGKIGTGDFVRSRFKRIFVPLTFGILVIVPPQTYFEVLRLGEHSGSFMDFYLSYLSLDQAYTPITPTWNHLWYLVYIMAYSLTLALLLKLIPAHGWAAMQRGFDVLVRGPMLIITPVLLFALIRFTLADGFPTTNALVNDWANHAKYFGIFMLGFWAAKSSVFWDAVQSYRWVTLGLVLILGISLTIGWNNWAYVTENETLLLAARIGRVVYMWVVILALMGLAQAYLNRSSKLLTYLSQAVYPYYILHQTVIILAGVALTPMALGKGLEFTLVTMLTAVGCGLTYHYVIRPSGLLRPLFGLKSKAELAEAAALKLA